MNLLRNFIFSSFLCFCTAAIAHEVKYIDPAAPNGIATIKVSCKATANGKLNDLTDCPEQLFEYFLKSKPVKIGKWVNTTSPALIKSKQSDNLPLGKINHSDNYYAFYDSIQSLNCILEKGLNDEKNPTDMIVYYYIGDKVQLLYCELVHQAS